MHEERKGFFKLNKINTKEKIYWFTSNNVLFFEDSMLLKYSKTSLVSDITLLSANFYEDKKQLRKEMTSAITLDIKKEQDLKNLKDFYKDFLKSSLFSDSQERKVYNFTSFLYADEKLLRKILLFKINELHKHFSKNKNFAIENVDEKEKTFPRVDLMSYDFLISPQIFSENISELFSKTYHINIGYINTEALGISTKEISYLLNGKEENEKTAKEKLEKSFIQKVYKNYMNERSFLLFQHIFNKRINLCSDKNKLILFIDFFIFDFYTYKDIF